MRRLAIIAAGVSLLAGTCPSQASDHLFTAVGAGGLTTTSSNPFVKTNGRSADTVPGQGSPLSGADHTTPAVEMGSLLTHHFTQPNTNANPGNGTLKTPPPVTAGKVAPSANSPHTAVIIP
ncbi:hypothetical protein [Bradyrhizobium sp. ORS 86]|uniref:hypothetical protein n=1 Tax=unclassified Bradyrhizobium TaxID=2631580 RepID=UPI00388F6EB0